MTTSTILALSALAVVLAAIAVLLCSAHIPGLRVLTGAAPLEAEESEQDADYQRSLDLGLLEDPETFAARIATQTRKEQS